MSALAIYAWGVTVLLLAALAWGMFSKSRYHRAKAEVYQEFADTFRTMRPVFRTAKAERRAASKRDFMSLVLCDPLVRDGLADALEEAEGHWTRLSFDEPREWKIVRIADPEDSS